VGRERSPGAVELVDGVLQAEVALLDKVTQVHALGKGVAAGDADHQPEVGPDEAVLGGSGVRHGARQLGAGLTSGDAFRRLVAGLDDARQRALLLRREEGNLADLVEVEADRIVHVSVSNRWRASRIPQPRVPEDT
jgi:hypothetical protein